MDIIKTTFGITISEKIRIVADIAEVSYCDFLEETMQYIEIDLNEYFLNKFEKFWGILKIVLFEGTIFLCLTLSIEESFCSRVVFCLG